MLYDMLPLWVLLQAKHQHTGSTGYHFVRVLSAVTVVEDKMVLKMPGVSIIDAAYYWSE